MNAAGTIAGASTADGVKAGGPTGFIVGVEARAAASVLERSAKRACHAKFHMPTLSEHIPQNREIN